ncbi:hypothetical protein H311_03735, partial [Anncaliia algerae PRA109]
TQEEEILYTVFSIKEFNTEDSSFYACLEAIQLNDSNLNDVIGWYFTNTKYSTKFVKILVEELCKERHMNLIQRIEEMNEEMNIEESEEDSFDECEEDLEEDSEDKMENSHCSDLEENEAVDLEDSCDNNEEKHLDDKKLTTESNDKNIEDNKNSKENTNEIEMQENGEEILSSAQLNAIRFALKGNKNVFLRDGIIKVLNKIMKHSSTAIESFFTVLMLLKLKDSSLKEPIKYYIKNLEKNELIQEYYFYGLRQEKIFMSVFNTIFRKIDNFNWEEFLQIIKEKKIKEIECLAQEKIPLHLLKNCEMVDIIKQQIRFMDIDELFIMQECKFKRVRDSIRTRLHFLSKKESKNDLENK